MPLESLHLYLEKSGNQALVSGGKTKWDDGKKFEGRRGQNRWNNARAGKPGAAENLAVVFICYRLYALGHPGENQFHFPDFPQRKIGTVLSQRKATNLWHQQIFDDRIRDVLGVNGQNIFVQVEIESRLIHFSLDRQKLSDQNNTEFAKSLHCLLASLVGEEEARSYVQSYAGSYANKLLGNASSVGGEQSGHLVNAHIAEYCREWRQVYDLTSAPRTFRSQNGSEPPEIKYDADADGTLASRLSLRQKRRLRALDEVRLDRYLWPVLKWRKGDRGSRDNDSRWNDHGHDDPTDSLDETWRIIPPPSRTGVPTETTTAGRSTSADENQAAAWTLLKKLQDDQLMVVYDSAGMGKTAFSHMLLKLLLAAHEPANLCHKLTSSENSPLIIIRIEGAWPRNDRGQPLDALALVIKELLGVHNGIHNAGQRDHENANLGKESSSESLDSLRVAVEQAMKEKRVFVFVDGFDQMTDDDRLASINCIEKHRYSCNWLLFGRAYSLQPYSGEGTLLSHIVYRVRIEPFDRKQQDLYFEDYRSAPLIDGQVLDTVCRNRNKMERDLGVPLHLATIRQLIDDSIENKKQLPKVESIAALHLQISNTLLDRVLQRKSKHGNIASERDLLREVAGVLAIQMMLDENRNGVVYTNIELPDAEYRPGDKVRQFVDRCKNRFLTTRIWRNKIAANAVEDEEDWTTAIDLLGTDAFSYRLELDRSNDSCQSFRTRKTMEWYAAHYLAKYVSDDELDGPIEGAGPSSVSDFLGTEEWTRCWELATEMPEGERDWGTVVRVCKRLFAEPKRNKARPCYEMHLAWERWLSVPDSSGNPSHGVADVMNKFHETFEKLLKDGNSVARSIVDGFPTCILPGDFVMGSPESEDGRQEDETEHRVRLTKPYSLHQFPVTNVQYELFDPPHHSERCSQSKEDDQPVVNVSWYEAWCFAKWAAHPKGEVRLPTEAEWEYACRGGAKEKTAFWFNNDPEEIGEHAWYSKNSGRRTHTLDKSRKVGGHENPFGFYDMHGNIQEWCADWYGEYDEKVVEDPGGLSIGSARVLRGGSWYDLASICRAATRSRIVPSRRSSFHGFRLLLSPSAK